MNDFVQPPSPQSSPPPPPAVSVSPVSVPGALSAEERNWGMIAHLSALTGMFTGIGNVVGPLVVWLIKKDSSPYVAAEAKEALNFHLTWLLAAALIAIVSIPLMFVLIGFLTLGLAGLIPVISWIFSVIAGIQAGEGKPYRYPLTIRFVK